MAAPYSQVMPLRQATDSLGEDGIILRQHTSQCCRVLCCQPNINWVASGWTEEIETLGASWKTKDSRVHDGPGAFSAVESSPPIAWVQEDAPWCGRCYSYCSPGSRPTRLAYHEGGEGPDGALMFAHTKGWTMGQNQFIMCGDGGDLRVPCCCFLPYLKTTDAQGAHVGTSRYKCDHCLFIPKYEVGPDDATTWFLVRPDTCCGGCCVQCRCQGRGAKCCRIPFFIRDPHSKQKLAARDCSPAVFVDLWAGWKAECCTKRDLYELKWPANSTPEQKATLLGLAHLIDLTIVEQQY